MDGENIGSEEMEDGSHASENIPETIPSSNAQAKKQKSNRKKRAKVINHSFSCSVLFSGWPLGMWNLLLCVSHGPVRKAGWGAHLYQKAGLSAD